MSRSGDKKPFTAELNRRRAPGAEGAADIAAVLRAIEALRADVLALATPAAAASASLGSSCASADGASSRASASADATTGSLHARPDQEEGEIRLLKIELNALAHSIETTKKEIALLMAQDSQGRSDRLTTVTNELDEIVAATENATNTILDGVEHIASLATQIQAQEKDSYIRHLADEIQELTLGVFEACNFQDLTGQRISRIVCTMKYIETRVERMMAIWGPDSFRDLPLTAEDLPSDADRRLLNGPQDQVQGISQDEIDLLFG